MPHNKEIHINLENKEIHIILGLKSLCPTEKSPYQHFIQSRKIIHFKTK
jgi:hypothetical protein